MEAGRLELEHRVFAPGRLAQEVMALLRPQAEKKGLSFLLWNGGLPERLMGDPNRLQQIWLNLLSNGVKFTESGEVRLTVFSERQTDGRWRLYGSVSDSGIGMPPELRSRLFGAFSQADSSDTRRHGGSGLGLAISARLVAMMDGTLSVDSALGKGSRFDYSVMLDSDPAADAAAASMRPRTLDRHGDVSLATVAETAALPIPSDAAPPALDRLRVLVAEDNPVNKTLALSVLQRLGIDAHAVSDGRQAVQAACLQSYDVVLMDVQMPELDGIEATLAIRALPAGPTRPWIIAVTANALPQEQQRCIAAGMDDFVAKPYRPDTLRHALARARARPAVAGG
jgi:CheY-like chemotaxis protein